jgi:hypothetical protein
MRKIVLTSVLIAGLIALPSCAQEPISEGQVINLCDPIIEVYAEVEKKESEAEVGSAEYYSHREMSARIIVENSQCFSPELKWVAASELRYLELLK